MKIRNGFVSNSSSSSFIVRFKDEPTVEKCVDLIKETWGHYNVTEEEFNTMGQQLYDLLMPYTGKKCDKWTWAPITPKSVKEYEKQGYKLYEFWLSDHSNEKAGIALPDRIRDKVYSGAGMLECEWSWMEQAPEDIVAKQSQH